MAEELPKLHARVAPQPMSMHSVCPDRHSPHLPACTLAHGAPWPTCTHAVCPARHSPHLPAFTMAHCALNFSKLGPPILQVTAQTAAPPWGFLELPFLQQSASTHTCYQVIMAQHFFKLFTFFTICLPNKHIGSIKARSSLSRRLLYPRA